MLKNVRTPAENYDLDLVIAESNGIPVDLVDQIPFPIVEIIREYFYRKESAND